MELGHGTSLVRRIISVPPDVHGVQQKITFYRISADKTDRRNMARIHLDLAETELVFHFSVMMQRLVDPFDT
jgi:hypothetical protein